MDKRSAIKLVRDTFESPFDKRKFAYLLSNMLDHIVDAPFIYRGSYIPDAYKPYIRTLERIGKYEDREGNKIDLLIVRLKKETSLERARTMQRNFIAWYLNGSRGDVLKDAALAAFVSPDTEDWRFSLVKMDYRLDATGGKVKVKKELTPARRFSFLVGKNEDSHTAQSYLLPVLEKKVQAPTLKELEEAFSIERVTREFFERYRDLFLRVKKDLDEIVKKDKKIGNDFTKKCVTTADFAKKLLGQIVFLYFLQKKGWLGVGKDEKGDFRHWGTGPKNFLRRLFKKHIILYDNFFDDLLEPLFYEALATERESDYYARFNCKIPFLNGGLFEPINDYDWVNTDILLPNEMFYNDHKTKEGDIGTGILDVFDRYNFTVKEDEPLEKEVAVDPEMLGKVFENLLAENLRKGQGTYYTPREIVHYMCQESLINYLDTAVNTGEISLTQEKPIQERLFGGSEPEQLGLKTSGYKIVVPRKDIEDFIRKGEFAIENDTARQNGTKSYKYQVPESIRKNAQLLDEKLKAIKICDPAIGSGAFPVGMMHEIVRARNVLETYLKAGKGSYEFKRHCIQESLYGVDIDPGAIEIAKLRLWLSLVVDEENYNDIKPLPNLDYKIMQGNSLIEDFQGISLNPEKKDNLLFNGNEDMDKLIEDLHNKQKALFNATHRREKEKLKEKVENAIVDIFHHELKRQKGGYFRELDRIEESASQIPKEGTRKNFCESEKAKLDKRYKFDFEAVENELREMTRGNRVRNFFPWNLYFADVFRKNGGFDVVIVNPPYVKEYTDRSVFNGLRTSPYYQGKMDIWYFFGCMGLDILSQNGIQCFIAPNNWISNAGASIFRNKIIKEAQIIQFINFGNYKIFESADIQTMVYLLQKSDSQQTYELSYSKLLNDSIDTHELEIFLNSKHSDNNYYKKYTVLFDRSDNQNDYIRFLQKDMSSILNKIQDQNVTFLYEDEVAQGIVAPQDFLNRKNASKLGDGFRVGDGIFVLSDEEKKRINWTKRELEIIKPYYTTAELQRYFGNANNNYWIIYAKSDMNRKIKNYPNIKQHLDKYRSIITSDFGPYGLHRARNEQFFKNEKIISLRKCASPAFTYTDFDCYVSQTFFIVKTERLDLKYLTAILNSKLIEFWLLYKGKLQGNQYQVDKIPLSKIPLKKLTQGETQPFITIADQILSLKKSNPQADTGALETEIDRMVYKLYDLTAEEIAIVEESAGRR